MSFKDYILESVNREYKEKYSVMEKVYIGDFVDSEVKHLGLTETMKVIGTTYDVISETEKRNRIQKQKQFNN